MPVTFDTTLFDATGDKETAALFQNFAKELHILEKSTKKWPQILFMLLVSCHLSQKYEHLSLIYFNSIRDQTNPHLHLTLKDLIREAAKEAYDKAKAAHFTKSRVLGLLLENQAIKDNLIFSQKEKFEYKSKAKKATLKFADLVRYELTPDKPQEDEIFNYLSQS